MDPRSTGARSTWLALGIVGVAAGCGSDQVQPGYYGALDDAGGDASSSSSSSSSSSGGDDALAPADTSTSSSSSGDMSSGDDAASEEAGTPTSPNCNMNGRWLVAQRVLADAIGQKQASHNWFYYEINQNADQLTVTKGLQCGYEVIPITSLGASVSSQQDWAGFLAHDSDTGRKGTMEVAASGCQVSLEKRYTVRGATVLFYSDPNQTMPTASQEASGSTPGWEDWDMDGNPGITLIVGEGGSNLGNLYCAQRDWNQYDGPVAANATTFSVPATWGSDQDALGYSGSMLVEQQASPDSDATQNYAWFAKLGPTQATGSDSAICAAVRSLVKTLTPDALN
jgi:hypothetical protein